MKKDFYFVIGIVALVLAGSLGAWWIYHRQQSPKVDPAQVQANPALARADMKLLLGEGSPSIGVTMARVQLVEFLDPECESCQAMHPVVKKIIKDYESKLRYTLRYMPFHGNSVYAASLLEAAREQNKYWEALDLIFEKQAEWGSHHAPRPELLPKILEPLKLDMPRLLASAKNPAIKARIENDKQDGMKLGVRGTPTFFVNGRILNELGDGPLRSMIDEELHAPL